MNNYEIGIKISKNTIIGNVFLSIIKVLIGLFGHSVAMISDGIHSLSDVITTLGVIIGLKFASKPADTKHQYGHEKIESISSIFLGFILFLVAIFLGITGIKTILDNNYAVPSFFVIIGALISIITKEWMYHYTIKYAKLTNSQSLKADAWHHRSDALSSVAALIGILGARLGFPILDPLVSIVICIVIIKVSIDILKESISQIIDESANNTILSEINLKLNNINGIKHIDTIKTRQHANKIYVDIEVSVDKAISVEEGHNIAMQIHKKVEEIDVIKHCMVHVNPYYPIK